MFPPGIVAVSIDLSTSRTVSGRWLTEPSEPSDAVDDEPFSVDDPVLAVGDVPRGGVWADMVNRRRGLVWGLSLGLGSFSTTEQDEDARAV